jgi:excisionase family DNA binding protein
LRFWRLTRRLDDVSRHALEPGHDMLSTGDIARLLGTSRQHVVDLCERGDLPFVWVGRRRRIQRSAVDKLVDRDIERLTRDQERSLWLHRALLGYLMTEPDQVLSRARENVDRLLQQRPSMTTHWLEEWLRVLDGGVDEVAEVLTSRSPRAVELRQNSPFAGTLPQETRSHVLAAFIKHWRDSHGGAPGRTGKSTLETSRNMLAHA